MSWSLWKYWEYGTVDENIAKLVAHGQRQRVQQAASHQWAVCAVFQKDERWVRVCAHDGNHACVVYDVEKTSVGDDIGDEGIGDVDAMDKAHSVEREGVET